MSKIKFYKDAAKEHQVYPELDPEDITKFESLEDIENAFPNVSGEDTNLTLNHTVEAPMKLELAPSELEQETTSGKNLCDIVNVTKTSAYGTYSYNNGIITITPTSTSSACRLQFLIPKSIFELEQTYTLSCVGANKVTVGYAENVGDTSNYAYFGMNNNGSTLSFTYTTIPDGYNYICFYLYNKNATVNINWTITDIQVEKGSTATDFEPYTGGRPQPNPDFPSQVHSVSGSNKIEVCGKNLLNLPNGTFTNYGVTAVVENGKITLNGTATQTSFVIIPLENNIEINNSNFTLSLNNSNVISDTSSEARAYTSGSTYFACQFGKINNSKVFTDRTAVLTRFQIRTTSGITYSNFVIYPQIEMGTSVSDFEIYNGRNLSLDLPVENLFDISKLTVGNATINGNTITMLGSSDYHSIPNDMVFSDFADLKVGETYTLSFNTTYTTQNRIFLRGSQSYWNNGGSHTITQEELNDRVAFYGTEGNTISNIQIEPGTKVNAYTPFGATPLEYCKLGTYSDVFFKNDPSDPNYDSSLELDKWYLKKNIGKTVLDGTENWVDWNLTGEHPENITGYLLDNYVNYNNLSGGDIRGICDYFKVYSNGWVYAQSFGLRQVGDTLRRFYVAIDKNITPTLEDYKTWLGTHNTTLYYVLATPEYILLNDTLQHQLDDIYNWVESYPGQTNISQINNDLPFIISAHAMKDLSVIDKYPTENSEHLVESGGVYEVINDLDVVQEEHTTQIKALERASLIYNAMPKATATGTDLTINDTAECPLELALSGNTSQETTTGIQCFDKESINPAASSIVSQLDTGIKLTNAWATNILTNASIVEQLKPDTTYSCKVIEKITSRPETMTEYQVSLGLYRSASGDTPSAFIVLINDNSAKRTAPLNTDIEYVKTFTTPSDLTNLSLLSYTFMTSSGASGTIELKDLMIVEGSYTSSNFPDYEQFTGETSSPNPDYPQNIHTISGDNTIKVCNKNFAYLKDGTYTKENDTAIINNNLITLNTSGSTGSNSYFSFGNGYTQTWAPAGDGIKNVNDLKLTGDGGNYIATIYTNKTISGSISFRIYTSNNRELMTNIGSNMTSTINISLEDGEHIKDYGLWSGTASIFNDYQIRVQLEKGTTTTSYILRKEQSLSLNLPVENLVSSHTIGNNIILLNNAASTTDYVFNPGTYTISAKGTNLVSVYYKAVSGNQTRLGNLSDLPITINAAENFNIWFYYVGMVEGDVYDIQLEPGTKANSYTPFGTPALEYCKIGFYSDEFIYNTTDTSLELNKWYLKKNIYKKVFDGTESWQINGTSGTDYRHALALYSWSDSEKPININYTYLSKYFIAINRGNNSDIFGKFYAAENFFVFHDKNAVYDNDGFKNWLSAHNTPVYYVTKTPTYILLNDTLQQQLNDIAEAISYQDQTNISQTNNDLPFIITVTAVQDINKLIATLTNAIIEIGGE